MASGVPVLALKAAAVAAVLAVLIMPSMGRCPSLGPEPPAPPTPAPAPAPSPSPGPSPAPAISCMDCWSNCYVTCRADAQSRCSEQCNRSGCDFCISSVRQQCEPECCSSSSSSNGTSSSCSCDDCNNRVASYCHGSCSSRDCHICLTYFDQHCKDGCSRDCAPPACM